MATLTSTSTLTHRGSASLTVAPTQNTAPVHEFRCLYTRDLHKKAKKWHDGSLRFHAFNRRVMVYDDAKNYIGDLHYRQEEEFGEGVELQLDRGVKVEVGERLGETQTDLGPILDRQRPERNVPQLANATALSTRPLSTGPSQRPKSLLEVLGPSQGRLGRARFPLQSPYQQRQSVSRNEPIESPPKRQRLSGDGEHQSDHVQQPTRSAHPARPSLPQPKQPSKPSTPSKHGAETPIMFEDVLDLSSDEEPKRRRLKEDRLATISGKNQRKGHPDHHPTPGLTRPTVGHPTPQNVHRNEPHRSPPNRQKAPSNSGMATKGAPSKPPRKPIPGTARLLLGQPKARPKLTCLLPFTTKKSITKPSSADPCLASSHGTTARASPIRAEKRSPVQNEDDELNEEGRQMQPIELSSAAQSPSHGPGEPENVDSSPLFIPEDNPQPESLFPQLLPAQEDFSLPGLTETQCSHEPPKETCSPQHLGFNSSAEQEGAEVVTRLSDQHAHPEADQGMNHWSKPDAVPAQDATARQFRRIFSENDALEDDGHVLLPGPVHFESRSPLQLLENLASRRSPVKSKSPAKLQRWASGSTALDDEGNKEGEPTEESSKGEKGPWTSEEAFLLFDWWPTELEKPVFWKSPTTEEMLPRTVPGAGAGFRLGITTARQFLRDDINAL